MRYRELAQHLDVCYYARQKLGNFPSFLLRNNVHACCPKSVDYHLLTTVFFSFPETNNSEGCNESSCNDRAFQTRYGITIKTPRKFIPKHVGIKTQSCLWALRAHTHFFSRFLLTSKFLCKKTLETNQNITYQKDLDLLCIT